MWGEKKKKSSCTDELYLLPLKRENEMPFFMTPSQSVSLHDGQTNHRIFLTKSFFALQLVISMGPKKDEKEC
jgi:hypothetical protein